MKNTNWSSPKTNIFAGVNDLRKALASGYNARLIRLKNEECNYPILEKKHDSDFRNYKFSIGYISSINKIKKDPSRSEFEKHLALNYISCYGTQEAIDKYYKNGELNDDNFKGMGVGHLVNVDDMIKFMEFDNSESGGHVERAKMIRKQYRTPENEDKNNLFDFFTYGFLYTIKKFKRKLWVVELLNKNEEQPSIPIMTKILIGLINIMVYPLKYIPKRSVLHMNEYKVVTYRVGAVVNGFSIEFHIPKKFGFK